MAGIEFKPTPRAVSEARVGSRDATTATGAQPWFGIALLALVLLGIGIGMRVAFAIGWTDGTPLHGDPLGFQQIAANIANGKGYAVPSPGRGNPVPTAVHPPVFSLVLALLDLVKIRSVDGHRLALALIAAGGIVAMGLLGRRLMGPVVGLMAAGIAALSPLWIQPSAVLTSESVYLVVIPMMLLLAIGCIDRPNRRRCASLGIVIGLAALTRSEATTLVVLLGLPVVAFAFHSWRQRAIGILVLLAGFAAVVGPWLIRNDVKMGELTCQPMVE